MHRCVLSRTAAVPRATRRLTCSHDDLFAWGLSPPEHDADLSKADSNRMKTQFYNAGQRRCTLCDEHLEVSFAAHSGYVCHVARVGILERAIATLQKEEEEATGAAVASRHPSPGNGLHAASKVRQRAVALVNTWWRRLSETDRESPVDYKRIPSLSAATTRQRLWRVRFLLEFLRDRGVIRDSLTLGRCATSGESGFARTKRFERSEMIGDNIVKVVVPDRLVRLFPAAEGGVTYKLACIQQLLDSNEGLLQIYDYIDLNSIIGVRLPNNKTKSDVVESLFGELQTFLWASDVIFGLNQYPAIPTSEHRYVKALVSHLLNELTHMVIMWRIESTLENAREFLEEHLQRRALHQRNGKRSSGGCVAIKERDCDRSRYAVLPLLMPLPHSNASTRATKAATGQEAEWRSASKSEVREIQERGTPRMLFPAPIPQPPVMVSHYRPRMRVVYDANVYRMEVIKALSRREIIATIGAPAVTSSIDSEKRPVDSKRGEEKAIQKQHRQRCIPWGEMAAEKYPTWRRDLQLSNVRHCVEEYLTQRGLYAESINWSEMTLALTQRLASESSPESLTLQKDPAVALERPTTTEDTSDVAGVALAERLCFPPLAGTVR